MQLGNFEELLHKNNMLIYQAHPFRNSMLIADQKNSTALKLPIVTDATIIGTTLQKFGLKKLILWCVVVPIVTKKVTKAGVE